MDEENIFDEDEALDYIIYKETTDESDQTPKSGCLGLALLLLLPLGIAKYLL